MSEALVANAIAGVPAFPGPPTADLAGRSVRLKLTLTQAALYAFWF